MAYNGVFTVSGQSLGCYKSVQFHFNQCNCGVYNIEDLSRDFFPLQIVFIHLN